jgi:hypothetical protein
MWVKLAMIGRAAGLNHADLLHENWYCHGIRAQSFYDSHLLDRPNHTIPARCAGLRRSPNSTKDAIGNKGPQSGLAGVST